jgi:diguanylate cyclase (GGDEF)-like protein/PAS domain S-box-containing protein
MILTLILLLAATLVVGGLLWWIRQREVLHRSILDTSSVAIFLVDLQGRLTQANQTTATLFARSMDSLIGSEYVSLIHPNERQEGHARMLALLAGDVERVDVDRMYWRADGTEFWGRLTGRRYMGTNGKPSGLVGVIADITERKRTQDQLQLAASVFSHAQEGILITTIDGTIIDVNQAFSRITGYSREEVIGKNPRLLNSGRQGKDFYTSLYAELADKGQWHGEVWNRRSNGELYAQMQTISAVSDAKGQVQHYVALFSDITANKAHQSQLEHIAHFDALTSLPNRVLLADRLQQGMVQALRRDQPLAVAFLDLDGFKSINDQHGHEAGDQLLVAVASRMKQCLRDGDTLARMGGDEFVAVLVDLDDVADSLPLITRLLAAAAQPVAWNGQLLQVSASLGVTFYPQPGDINADQLLRQADQAMYQAKVAGKNRHHVFDATHDNSLRGHHESLEHIRKGLHAGEFVLHYQPKVNMRSGEVVGAEALIRWQHPERGLLPPSAFLPVVEETLLAVEIGEWVINTALTQMAQWKAQGLQMPVSVNIGARQLQEPSFIARLQALLHAHPEIEVQWLELEVLETSALEDLARVSQVIQNCRRMGVRFALDDFGTGYSSLTYLKHLPAALLKIDQSFVRDMLDDPDDLAILEGVIGLASAFRRQVIAEGVETVEHGAMLLCLGCDLAQGFGIARPMPAHDLPAWAQAWKPDATWANVTPVQRGDFPLLFASVEHRAWSAAMDHFLRGQREAPPELDAHLCHFGQWLNNEGASRHGKDADFQRIHALHDQAHILANALCELFAEGHETLAVARLPELHAVRDALLAQLKLMLPSAHASAPRT